MSAEFHTSLVVKRKDDSLLSNSDKENINKYFRNKIFSGSEGESECQIVGEHDKSVSIMLSDCYFDEEGELDWEEQGEEYEKNESPIANKFSDMFIEKCPEFKTSISFYGC